MVDELNEAPRFENIKGLLQDLVEKLDQRMVDFRIGTPFEGVRSSDAKTFMMASRHQRSIANIAKAQGISRQAAHKSVQRLVDRGVVELVPMPDNKRDKLVCITAYGDTARIMAAKQLKQLEVEFESKIGTDRLEELRQTLKDLL